MRIAACSIALGLTFLSSQAPACSCGLRPTIGEAFVEASTVQLVTVESVRDRLWFGKWLWYKIVGVDTSEYENYVSGFGFEITARVVTSFKGLAVSRVRFLTGRGGGDCGLPFKEGGQYLVYLSSSAGNSQSIVGLCGRTAPAEKASEDLIFLQGHP